VLSWPDEGQDGAETPWEEMQVSNELSG
jgi:hypothetical protein